MRRTSGHGRPLRACAQQGLRSAMPTASRFWRSFRAHSGHYVSERIAKRCRCGSAAAGASLVRQAPGLLDAFPMQRNIQSFALLLLGDPQPDGLLDYLQNDETPRESINDGHGDAFQLSEHGGVQTADLLAGEYAGEQRADNAADTVHAEGVQGVVVAQRVLQGGCCNEAYDPPQRCR